MFSFIFWQNFHLLKFETMPNRGLNQHVIWNQNSSFVSYCNEWINVGFFMKIFFITIFNIFIIAVAASVLIQHITLVLFFFSFFINIMRCFLMYCAAVRKTCNIPYTNKTRMERKTKIKRTRKHNDRMKKHFKN